MNWTDVLLQLSMATAVVLGAALGVQWERRRARLHRRLRREAEDLAAWRRGYETGHRVGLVDRAHATSPASLARVPEQARQQHLDELLNGANALAVWPEAQAARWLAERTEGLLNGQGEAPR